MAMWHREKDMNVDVCFRALESLVLILLVVYNFIKINSSVTASENII